MKRMINNVEKTIHIISIKLVVKILMNYYYYDIAI